MYAQPGPFTPPPARKRSTLKGCLIAFAAALTLFVVLGIVGAAMGDGKDADSAATPEKTPAAANSPAKKKVTNGIGREYRDGKFAFTVTKIKRGVRRVGGQYVGKTAQGQFVLVYVTVHNIGDEARTFDSGSQKLRDTRGREFSADTEATIALGDQSKAFLEDINPGNGVHGILVFDVPRGITLKSLDLHDSPFSGGVTVPLAA
jgi:hypothetical protein